MDESVIESFPGKQSAEPDAGRLTRHAGATQASANTCGQRIWRSPASNGIVYLHTGAA
jgi:hypothetical protein